MTRMNSRPVTITQVYPQDSAPSDTRDGILWVDTSVSPPDTYTYDADTASWEPVATENLKIQDTAPSSPSDGMIWVDTSASPPSASVYDATNSAWVNQVDQGELDSHAGTPGAHHTRPSAGTGLFENANANFETELGWRLDGSVSTSQADGSYTYSLASSYDQVMVLFEYDKTSANGRTIDMQINGDTGTNYDYIDLSATETNNDTKFKAAFGFVSGNGTTTGYLLMSGRWSGEYVVRSMGVGSNLHTSHVEIGNNTAAASPLSSFTIFSGASESADISLNVYGRYL